MRPLSTLILNEGVSMKLRIILGLIISCLSFVAIAANDEVLSEEEKSDAWANELWQSLDRKTGEIKLEGTGAVLNVPENFFYLSSKDADKVLVDVWGNPPGQSTLGMLFPAEMTPFDDNSWAVTIEYEEDGYVSDEDAGEIDYTELLTQMQEDTLASSKQRVKEGYDAVELVGWASPPFYDATEKKLHWAQEYKIEGFENNTLNYNIRVLGRKGVLVLNFIAGMDQKALIDSNIDTVLSLADFDQGSKYSDFDPDIDQIAAYGLGALVAGKVAAKTGFLIAAILFLKKFGIFILIGLGALFKKVFFSK